MTFDPCTLSFTKMARDLHDIAGSMRQVTELGLEHQETVEAQVVDILRDYSGIIHTLPVLVKLHEEAMELFNASKEKDSVCVCVYVCVCQIVDHLFVGPYGS